MELRFSAILCSELGNESSDVGHIKCSRGPQVPRPCSKLFHNESRNMDKWRLSFDLSQCVAVSHP